MITMLVLLALTLAVVIAKRATILAERRREKNDGDWAEEFCAEMRNLGDACVKAARSFDEFAQAIAALSVARDPQPEGGSTIHL